MGKVISFLLTLKRLSRKESLMSSQTPLPIVVGMALAMVSSSLRAQSVADHTRLFSAGPTVTGMAAAVNDQQVELLQEAASPSFAYGNISELQESAGAQSQWKAGLKWGAIAGGGVGLLAGNLVGESCDVLVDIVEAFDADTDEGCGGFRIGAMLLYGAFGGAVGGLVGMGVGALIKTEPEVSASLGSTVFTFSPTIVPRLGLEGRPGLVLGTHVAFCQRPSKAAQVWPSKIAHLAEVTSL